MINYCLGLKIRVDLWIMKAFIKISIIDCDGMLWLVMLWDGGEGHVMRWGDSEAYDSCYGF